MVQPSPFPLSESTLLEACGSASKLVTGLPKRSAGAGSHLARETG